MPVKLRKKKYEKFSDASAPVQKKSRANAYVASIERKQGIEPRTGKRTKTKTSRRQKGKTTTKESKNQ